MLEHLNKYHMVLASNSPRRKELLAGLGLSFTVKTLPHISESYPPHLKAGKIPLYLAESKAEAYRKEMADNDLIITADTIVWHQDKVYGKPQNEEDAFAMLQALSGETHHVYTGVCLMTKQFKKSFYADSQVRFSSLSEEEIRWYIDNYHPMDKAGAYGVQEWIGYIGVEYISGSYFNVMGLPVQRLYAELKQLP